MSVHDFPAIRSLTRRTDASQGNGPFWHSVTDWLGAQRFSTLIMLTCVLLAVILMMVELVAGRLA